MVRLYGVHWRRLHTITQTRVVDWDKFVCRLCTTNPEDPKTLWGTCECAQHIKSRGHQHQLWGKCEMSAHAAHQSSLPLPLPKDLAVAVFHSMPKAWQPPIGKPPPLRQPPPPKSPPPTPTRVQAIDYPREESAPLAHQPAPVVWDRFAERPLYYWCAKRNTCLPYAKAGQPPPPRSPPPTRNRVQVIDSPRDEREPIPAGQATAYLPQPSPVPIQGVLDHPYPMVATACSNPSYWPSGPPLFGPGNWTDTIHQAMASRGKASMIVSYPLAKLADAYHTMPPCDGTEVPKFCFYCRLQKHGAFIDHGRDRLWLCNNCQWWTNKELMALQCTLDDLK